MISTGGRGNSGGRSSRDGGGGGGGGSRGGNSSGGGSGGRISSNELDDWKKELKGELLKNIEGKNWWQNQKEELDKNEENLEKELKEATENNIPLNILKKRRKLKDDNSKEDIPLKIQKKCRKFKDNSSKTSVDILSINTNIMEQTYNRMKRSLDLYVMKAIEIQTEIKDSDSTKIYYQNLEKIKKLFGNDSKSQEKIKTFYKLQDDPR
ncbi:hypothetical protein Glove_232g184 [Diversispora epigaea]|uniref:Uncharacterized protein n=1 Tax=Diversispora epigaea TaxID=1348612 RepID=A0A397IBL8_9GLOM|nr:hypothetical protein Glove_232g184 [Diversispora epigaea]